MDENVENVDSVESGRRGKIICNQKCRKNGNVIEKQRIKVGNLCKQTFTQKIHRPLHGKMCINLWIMWITIVQAVFPQWLPRLRLPWLSTNHRGHNFRVKNFQSHRRWGNKNIPFPVSGFLSADRGRKCRAYRSPGRHRYQPAPLCRPERALANSGSSALVRV